jgi:hypothetical protein
MSLYPDSWPSMKVRAPALGGVGEQLLIDVQSTAQDAICQCVLTITAIYAEAGEPPGLSLAQSNNTESGMSQSLTP